MTRLRHSDVHAPGIRRVRRADRFRYLDAAGHAVDQRTRDRIDALAIPPAWRQVWIAPDPRGHIQAIGTDAAGRRQYRYHPAWRNAQDVEKFDRMLALAEVLPAARGRVTRELEQPAPTERSALAAAFRILDRAAPRVGSETYLEEHGTRGLSTVLVRHAAIEGDLVTFGFSGKGGMRWEAVIDDAALARVLARLAERSARSRLLAWRDEDRRWHPVTSAAINRYVHEVTGGGFTAKDFRTLRGTVAAAESLRSSLRAEASRRATPASGRLRAPQSAAVADRAIREAYRAAAAVLGNTPAVAKSSYVDPRVLDRYRTGRVLPPRGTVEHGLVSLLAE